MKAVLRALCCVAIFVASPADAIVIRVSPDGNASATLNDLAKDPKVSASLARAIALLKSPELRDVSGAPKESITLQLVSGIYRLSDTIKLDESCSGSALNSVIIQGAPDSEVIITGGRAVSGFVPVNDQLVLKRLTSEAASHVLQTSLINQGITDFGKQSRHGFGGDAGNQTALTLTFNNQPMTLARWPNEDFANIGSTPDGEKGATLTVEKANLASWADELQLLATGYWFNNWADTTLPIQSVDIANKRITLTEPKPPYGIKAGQRFFIQNAVAELDQPGEWYLDVATGNLYIWLPEAQSTSRPQSGEWQGVTGEVSPASIINAGASIEASILEKLLVIANAHHITLNNLTLQSARGDAITVQGGHHITIAHSTIRNIGNRAAVISGQDNGLTDMHIENIGEGAIVLQGGDRQTLTTANLYTERSSIRRFAQVSRTYQPAVLLTGVGNRAVGNTISDSAHTAILFTGNDHLISKNEIFNVCQETGDAGAIYTGRDWTARGTVISQNHLYEIPHNVLWGKVKGVYLDDQASGIEVSGNQFDDLYESVFIGGGRDNLIEGNTFRNGEISIYLDARGKKWKRAASVEKKDTIQKWLEAVPYQQSPYTDRYPHLSSILEDEPGMPKYNIARNNHVVGSSRLRVTKDAESGLSIEAASRGNMGIKYQ
ncbi:hypothetical protein OYT1_ch1481 [Ferriphaselus amnicola]|uniref:Right handed beta helix domain-containing protein n=1 Tax=Ferriphaselus amnicola TaxID=1188319 RepID=A0A2Z6GCY2_9PROT|nr:hypothetical protein OYT1_ch1481 [Ferriphaselus amnicola]